MPKNISATLIFDRSTGLQATGRWRITASSMLLGSRGVIETQRDIALNRSGNRIRGQMMFGSSLDPEGGTISTRWEMDINMVIPHPLMFNPTPEWAALRDGALTLLGRPRMEFYWEYGPQTRDGSPPTIRQIRQLSRMATRGENMEVLSRFNNKAAKREGENVVVFNHPSIQFAALVPHCIRGASGDFVFGPNDTHEVYSYFNIKLSMHCRVAD